MNAAKHLLLVLALLPLAGCGEIMKGVIVLGALQGDMEMGRSARAKVSGGPTLVTTSLWPAEDGLGPRGRLLHLADGIAHDRPDVLALRNASVLEGHVETLLDELWRRGVVYEAVSLDIESAILVRDDAYVVATDPASGPFTEGVGGWASVWISWREGRACVIVADLAGPEVPAQAEELLDRASRVATGVILACGLDAGDPAVDLFTAEGFERMAAAPLGGLILARGLPDGSVAPTRADTGVYRADAGGVGPGQREP